MSNYEKQVIAFAKKHGVELKVLYEEFRLHFPDDKQPRSVFTMELTRNGESYIFDFGQSIANTGSAPTMYDVLACLTKYDPGSFKDFCSDYGYDEDSRSAERTYHAVYEEYQEVNRLFGDIIEELSEIE